MKTLLIAVVLFFSLSIVKCQDISSGSTLRAEINILAQEQELYFPQTVKRFYGQNGNQFCWIKESDKVRQTWEAMLLLDCVVQFGLMHTDYHPDKLTYDSLRILMNEPEKVTDKQKARFDIMLTDALITFINHLHFGKLNPEFSMQAIDKGALKGFSAELELIRSIHENDFMSAVLSVQPKVKAYTDLQNYMRLIKGQYVDDCYEIPENEVRKVAINMERLRWANFDGDSYIHINIPSYTLNFHKPDSIYDFKVIVGRPENPSPVLTSAIGYFTTAPDWKVPHKIFVKELLPLALKNTRYLEDNHYTVYDEKGGFVEINSVKLKEISRNPRGYNARQSSGCDNALGNVVFRFPNSFDVYLHDTPDQKLFGRSVRALSHGCIRVQKAKDLAALMLQYDGSADRIPEMNRVMNAYQKKNFILKHPVPIKITYLTCSIVGGLPIFYKDIYHLDENLEKAIYNVAEPVVLN